MALVLIKPAERWDQAYQIRINNALQAEDLRNRKKGTDVELGPGEKLVVRSPDGNRWAISVSNAGAIGAVAL